MPCVTEVYKKRQMMNLTDPRKQDPQTSAVLTKAQQAMAKVFKSHMWIIHHRLDTSGLHGIIKTDIDRRDFLRSVNEVSNPDVS